MNSKMNRKGDVPLTLTWFFVFFIIVFIIFIFLAFTFIASKKRVLESDGANKVIIDGGEKSSISEKELALLLNYPVENRQTIKDLIYEWQITSDETYADIVKEKIQDEAKKILDKYPCKDDGYNFIISGEKGEIEIKHSSENLNYYFESVKKDLYFSNKKVNLQLFISKC